MKYCTASLSHIGGRESNQDYLGHIDNGTRQGWVVADGLGGHSGGEVASRLAVDAVIEAIRHDIRFSEEGIGAYIHAAHQQLQYQQVTDPVLAFMRTTLVVLLAQDGQARWAHVGDTRLYHLRHGTILSQTKDHSIPQSLVEAGIIKPEHIRIHNDRNRLLRSVGQEGELKVTHSTVTAVQPGDAFLLCSDGFWEYVMEPEMEADYRTSATPEKWLALMEERLLQRVPTRHDNYTAIAVCVEE